MLAADITRHNAEGVYESSGRIIGKPGLKGMFFDRRLEARHQLI